MAGAGGKASARDELVEPAAKVLLSKNALKKYDPQKTIADFLRVWQ